MSNVWEGLNPPYRTIVADPPWAVVGDMGAGGRRRRRTPKPYSTMEFPQIAELPVRDLIAPTASLFLWITAGLNRRGFGVQIAETWGFHVVGEIVWEKPNLGMGAFPRACHEIVLVGIHGPALVDAPRDVHSVQRWPQLYGTNGGKTHSAKPPAFFDLVEQVSPRPYVELFARQPRLGWDHWGYGYESAAS